MIFMKVIWCEKFNFFAVIIKLGTVNKILYLMFFNLMILRLKQML